MKDRVSPLTIEDLNTSLDTFRGAMALLSSLELSSDSGYHNYHKEMFFALQNLISIGLKDVEDIIEKLSSENVVNEDTV